MNKICAGLFTSSLLQVGLASGADVASVTFREEPVSWQVDGIAVEATVAVPAGPSRHAAVVLVAGSGPTDRDWNSPALPGKNGSGRLIAERLAALGYVTLRYDKRVSGPNAQENAGQLAGKVSLDGHAEELKGAVDLLRARKDVDPQRIFALGHSEGSIHAMRLQIASKGTAFAGLMLVGPPGRPLHVVLRDQLAAQLEKLPDGDRMTRSMSRAIDALVAGQPLPPLGGVPDAIKGLLMAIADPASQPFSHEFLAFDPGKAIQSISEPTLVLIGKKDIQVRWRADGRALETVAAGKPNITFVYPENANHVLKSYSRNPELATPEELAASYNGAESKLDEEAMRALAGWLAAHT